jgi:hypothetical protein
MNVAGRSSNAAAVVVSAIVFAAFDSALFDARRGWIYAFGVGAAGGAVVRAKDLAASKRDLKAERADPVRD